MERATRTIVMDFFFFWKLVMVYIYLFIFKLDFFLVSVPLLAGTSEGNNRCSGGTSQANQQKNQSRKMDHRFACWVGTDYWKHTFIEWSDLLFDLKELWTVADRWQWVKVNVLRYKTKRWGRSEWQLLVAHLFRRLSTWIHNILGFSTSEQVSVG